MVLSLRIGILFLGLTYLKVLTRSHFRPFIVLDDCRLLVAHKQMYCWILHPVMATAAVTLANISLDTRSRLRPMKVLSSWVERITDCTISVGRVKSTEELKDVSRWSFSSRSPHIGIVPMAQSCPSLCHPDDGRPCEWHPNFSRCHVPVLSH